MPTSLVQWQEAKWVEVTIQLGTYPPYVRLPSSAFRLDPWGGLSLRFAP